MEYVAKCSNDRNKKYRSEKLLCLLWTWEDTSSYGTLTPIQGISYRRRRACPMHYQVPRIPKMKSQILLRLS